MSPAPPDPVEVPVLLSIGSNLGDRAATLDRAVALLRQVAGFEVVRVSSWIETDPVGGPPQGRFLNGAIAGRTRLEPAALLGELQKIEAELGRVRGPEAVRWGPRTIDIDILLHGDRVLRSPELEVPHPRMLERAFVLEPAAEISPGIVHPLTRRTILDHWQSLRAEPSKTKGSRC